MENAIDFNKAVKKTCLKIGRQFLLAILFLYMLPFLSMYLKMSRLSQTMWENFSLIFFRGYICLALIIIVSLNIKRLLILIKKEMDTVYHNSMWLEACADKGTLTLKEFIETNDRIDKMQERIETMLENEKRRRDELIFRVSAASHDLKTPLTVIQGNSELLLYSDLKEEQREYMSDIAASTKRIDDYLNALIGYTKTFYDDRTEWKEYLLSDVIEAVEQEALYTLKDKSVLTVTNNTDEKGTVTLNLNYLLRAISNLIGNAERYGSAENKKIKLTVDFKRDRLSFTVWNNGTGLSHEALKNCDRLFYRADAERNGKGSHYGIGLAFVKRVAELHSGDLKISNQNDGVEFILELKAVE